MPTAKALGIKPSKSKFMDLSSMSLEELDELYAGTDTDSPQRIQVANEIDKRVVTREKKKKKSKGNLSKAEAEDILGLRGETLEKGKEMPVGTISNGRKKMPDGSWRPVAEGGRSESSDKSKKFKRIIAAAQERYSWMSKLKVGDTVYLESAKEAGKIIETHGSHYTVKLPRRENAVKIADTALKPSADAISTKELQRASISAQKYLDKK